MTDSRIDSLQYIIVVDGTELEARRLLSDRFSNRRGGARPDTLIPYSSVPCTIDELEASLQWITTSLAGSYSSISIGIGINSTLSWANFVIPRQIVALAQKYDTALKVSFSSPPRSEKQ